MQTVLHVHDIPSLRRPPTNLTLRLGELISSKENIYEDFPDIVLGQPVNNRYRIDDQLKRQMTKYFRLAEGPPHGQGAQPRQQYFLDCIDWNTLAIYVGYQVACPATKAKVVFSGLPNSTCLYTTPAFFADAEGVRDNSFVRYELLPDANANHANQPDRAVRAVYYGRVQDIFYVEYIIDLE
ncbi:hypothetical protein BDV93DRAFT_563337 [Ceratobasidium sp. AG-I]|nr:hypothetical protein BDV93DRAFT_563337 [Ceratobasidium sp. AG-I]